MLLASHTVMDQWDHLLVLQFNHVLNSSVAVVDIHSTYLQGGAERQTWNHSVDITHTHRAYLILRAVSPLARVVWALKE